MELDVIAESLARPFSNRRPDSSELQLATVLDEFSTHCFSRVANLWPVDPTQFRLDLPLINPDYLLVESAWQGNEGKWRYMVTSNSGPKPPLIQLVKECRKLGIPTVFWNKEDPPHFEEFLPTAKLFDHVLTTDADMIPKYKTEAGLSDVHLMRFAADSVLHTPRRTENYRKGQIAFAGQYFAKKFPERREQMDILFKRAVEYDFSIYSRDLGGNPDYQFPARYEKYVVGSLPYSAMVEAYRKYRIFLNVNSVTTSSTMCARRVYELSAAKTVVVGLGNEAIRSVYSEDEVLLGSTGREIEQIFDKLLVGSDSDIQYRITTQKAWRRTLSHHTYERRIEQIGDVVGLSKVRGGIEVHLVVNSTPSECQRLLKDLENQKFTFFEGITIRLAFAHKDDSAVYFKFNKQVTNGAPPRTKKYIGFVNKDYRYGSYYLNDLVLTLAQQPERFAAKVLRDNSAQVKDIEESPSSGLPAYGWLGAVSDDLVEDEINRLAREVRQWDDIPFYLADPFGIDGPESNPYEALLNS